MTISELWGPSTDADGKVITGIKRISRRQITLGESEIRVEFAAGEEGEALFRKLSNFIEDEIESNRQVSG